HSAMASPVATLPALLTRQECRPGIDFRLYQDGPTPLARHLRNRRAPTLLAGDACTKLRIVGDDRTAGGDYTVHPYSIGMKPPHAPVPVRFHPARDLLLWRRRRIRTPALRRRPRGRWRHHRPRHRATAAAGAAL